jgi:hypothetical protein
MLISLTLLSDGYEETQIAGGGRKLGALNGMYDLRDSKKVNYSFIILVICGHIRRLNPFMHVRFEVQENGPTKRTGDFRFLEIHETHNRALAVTGPADHPIKASEQHIGRYTACFSRYSRN